MTLRLLGLIALGTAACGPRDASRNERTTVDSADGVPVANGVGGEPIPQGDAARAAEIGAIVGATCAETAPLPRYGARGVIVDARGYGVSSGLYLRPGEQAIIAASGSWTVWQGVTAPFTADGLKALTPVAGCTKGALVATVGLSPEAPKHCIGTSGVLTADREGIVYFAMNDDASPSYHGGQVTAYVTSGGDQVPTVAAADSGTYAYCGAGSGWVELKSAGNLLLTVPAALADHDRATIAASLAKLDRYYSLFRELTGGDLPFEGQPLRLYPEFDVAKRGWMVAGDPLLFDPKNLNAVDPSRMKLLDLDAAGGNLFDLVRAMGLTFSRARGGRYQPDDLAAQAWGGLFALYAEEREPFGGLPRDPCRDLPAQTATGSLATLAADPWLELCLLSNLQKKYGWPFFTRFFQALPATRADWDKALPGGVAGPAAWAWLKGRFAVAAGADVTPLLSPFKIP